MKFKFKEERQNKTIQLGTALTLIFEECNLTDSLIIGRIRGIWGDIVGTLLATHSIPDRIFKNFLFISVDHPVYSNTLSFMKDIIIEKIKENSGSELVKDIRLEVKKLDWQVLSSKNVNQ
jgi:hypothetical protein